MSLLTDDPEARPSDSSVCPDTEMLFLAFMALMPRGVAWDNVEVTSERNSTIRKFMYALAKTWQHFEDAQCDALNEWFCITASEDLDGWMADYGVPDECDIYSADVCAKVVTGQEPTADYLTKLLEANGYIGEVRWLAGDDPEFPGVHSTLHVAVDMLDSPAMALATALPFPLGEEHALGIGLGQLDQVQCMLERYVPAHCVVSVNTAPPWTPELLGPSLLAWWDADDAASFTLEGTRVTGWADLVTGFNPDQISGAAARPDYSATGFAGRPCVLFEGVNYHLSIDATGPLPIGAAPCEIWVLAEQTALPADTIVRCAFAYGDGSNNGRRVSRNVVTAVNRARASTGNGAAQINVTDTLVDLSGRHVMRARFDGTATSISVDAGTPTSAAAVPATTGVRCRIGSNDGASSGLRWQGSIAAILVTELLTTEQAAALQAWLAARL